MGLSRSRARPSSRKQGRYNCPVRKSARSCAATWPSVAPRSWCRLRRPYRRESSMDLVTMARTAREGFARGLGALQTPDVPPPLTAAAEPIAQAMGALHRIESSGGAELAQAGPNALIAARQALSQLQSVPTQHPAVHQAIEAIAGSLGLVHQISQLAGQASVAP